MNLEQILRSVGLRQQRGGSSNPRMEQLGQYATMILGHAGRWAMFAALGMRCVISHRRWDQELSCGQIAIGQCVVCESPVCLDHSMVSARDGTQICFSCVGEAMRRRHGRGVPPPHRGAASQPGDEGPAAGWWGVPPAEQVSDQTIRRQHLDALELADDATEAEIRAAFRRLAAEHHPDKAQGRAAKQRAVRHFKRISQAYHWLIEHRRAA